MLPLHHAAQHGWKTHRLISTGKALTKSPSHPGVAQAVRDSSKEVLRADGCTDGETGSLLTQQQVGFSERQSNRREHVSSRTK